MNQTLLTAHGAPPNKNSKYKPIWTDRFFTGYFSNRNPLRSPLSAFYAEGWQMGKTDTLIDGANVEVSPRLTLIRRPGTIKYNSVNTIAEAPQSFYSFHRSDGQVQVIADTANVIYNVTPSSITSIYNKPVASKARFQGVGTQLYWGTGVSVPFWYDPVRFPGNAYQMGITPPSSSPVVVSFTSATGAATSLHGVKFNGTSQDATTSIANNNNTTTIEFWLNTTAVNQPIITLETSQTGTSTQVMQAVYVNSDGLLVFAVMDSGHFNNFNQSYATCKSSANGNGQINDGDWHHVVCTMTYNPAPSISSNGNVGITPNQSIVQTSTFSTNNNGSYNFGGNPPASASGSPSPLFVSIWIDGEKVVDANPQFWAYPIGTNGYWRVAEGTLTAGQAYTQNWFNGYLSEVAIYNKAISSPSQHFQEMIVRGVSNYESVVMRDTPIYWWKMNETSGTTMVDSAGSNTGTYVGSPLLNQAVTIIYVPNVRSLAYSPGQVIVDSNGNYQKVSVAGTSGSAQPTWNKNVNGATVDGTVTWINLGNAGLNLTTAQGTYWAYAFAGKNGNVSTCSPVSAQSGPQSGKIAFLHGYGSDDPQVNNILIFRVADGGSTLLYVGSLPNTNSTTLWQYADAIPDAGLNILMPAPVAHSNDPAPYGLTNFTFHLGRMWGSVGNTVYASAGPDCLMGNGNECWPPANYWNFPAQVNRLFSTSAGLIVCTQSGIYMLAGGPAIGQFYPQNLIERIGLASYDAADMHGSQITLFTTDRNLFTIDASTGFTDIGFPIKDQLINIDPTQAYVTYHQWGQDHALYLGNGISGWFRCAPQQPPDYQIVGPVWSPFASILNGLGCQALASVETSPGVWNLMIGTTVSNGYIFHRDSSYTIFSDNGTAYANCYATIGSIVLASPGEVAEIGFVTFDAIKRGNNPKVFVILDEISGTFTDITGYTVQDPPIKYGTTGSPASLFATRCYLRQSIGGATPPPVVCRHMQISYNFQSDTVMNELVSSTIYGRILVEG